MDGALRAEQISLRGYGGHEIAAYAATPEGQPARAGVLVIHHMPGWDPASKEIARRFAAHGYNAICPNLHHRHGPGAAPEEQAAAARAAGGTPDEQFLGDAAAALEWLRAQPSARARNACIGYCSGGRQSFLAALSLDVQAAVVCYGAFIAESPPPDSPIRRQPLLDRVGELRCPVLGLFGVEDTHPSQDAVATLDRALTEASKEHEFHSYDGAGHAFFAVDRPSYRVVAANDGWQRVWDFFERRLDRQS
ncbi:MAG: dienelactone hydrolase family protein [Candidatus Dormibacteraeota bacterium]|nr:dienelactone hydrolase family protein [Candidatus Dormibacteraeota bacterium]MBV9526615.1 dienelactone hydrolase family protein [Candidatus Dormibacteraeota bacterium]